MFWRYFHPSMCAPCLLSWFQLGSLIRLLCRPNLHSLGENFLINSVFWRAVNLHAEKLMIKGNGRKNKQLLKLRESATASISLPLGKRNICNLRRAVYRYTIAVDLSLLRETGNEHGWVREFEALVVFFGPVMFGCENLFNSFIVHGHPFGARRRD